jgi:hypothetical protein
MSDAKANEKGERQERLPDQPLKVSAGLEARPAGASDLVSIEKNRTNASDGSLGKHKGIAFASQQSSIEIDFGDRVASRMSPLTELDVLKPSTLTKLDRLSQTGSELVVRAQQNPALEPVAQLRKYADALPPGEKKEQFVKLSREQASELSPEMRARFAGVPQRVQPDAQDMDLTEHLQAHGSGAIVEHKAKNEVTEIPRLVISEEPCRSGVSWVALAWM